jgi:hypothetical protein
MEPQYARTVTKVIKADFLLHDGYNIYCGIPREQFRQCVKLSNVRIVNESVMDWPQVLQRAINHPGTLKFFPDLTIKDMTITDCIAIAEVPEQLDQAKLFEAP